MFFVLQGSVVQGCSAGVTLVFHSYSGLFHYCSEVFRCSANVPYSVFPWCLLLHWCSTFRCSVFQHSWFYSMLALKMNAKLLLATTFWMEAIHSKVVLSTQPKQNSRKKESSKHKTTSTRLCKRSSMTCNIPIFEHSFGQPNRLRTFSCR